MLNFSGFIVILCFMNLFIYVMLNILDFYVKLIENSDFFNKKFEEDLRFFLVIFYFGYFFWRVFSSC